MNVAKGKRKLVASIVFASLLTAAFIFTAIFKVSDSLFGSYAAGITLLFSGYVTGNVLNHKADATAPKVETTIERPG